MKVAAAPVEPLPTTYTPSGPAVNKVDIADASEALTTTTSIICPDTSANLRPCSAIRSTEPTGPKYCGGRSKMFSRNSFSGTAMIAPPPKPIIAIPAAMPRLSGNQRSSVATGDTYAKPSPHPPSTP